MLSIVRRLVAYIRVSHAKVGLSKHLLHGILLLRVPRCDLTKVLVNVQRITLPCVLLTDGGVSFD